MARKKGFWGWFRSLSLVVKAIIFIALGALFLGLIVAGLRELLANGLNPWMSISIGLAGLIILGVLFGVGAAKGLKKNNGKKRK